MASCATKLFAKDLPAPTRSFFCRLYDVFRQMLLEFLRCIYDFLQFFLPVRFGEEEFLKFFV